MSRDFVLLAVLCFFCGCSVRNAETSEETSEESGLEITATVLSYEHAVEWDHFSDGSYAAFDKITLEVIAPEQHARTTLSYTVSPSNVADDSPLRSAGTRLRITVPTSHFSTPKLYWGAVEDLVILP